MFRTVLVSVISSFFTAHTAIHTSLLTSCEQDQEVPFWSCSQTVSKPVWHIPLLCVQWKTLDDGQMNCPKYVAFCSKNKFEKLIHIVGFIIRIYHYARSPERQILVIMSPSWRWSECWPKHAGEDIANKIHHKYWSAFVGSSYIFEEDYVRRDGEKEPELKLKCKKWWTLQWLICLITWQRLTAR